MADRHDVHLIYNNQDIHVIEWIDGRLRDCGIVPWFFPTAANRAGDFEKEERKSLSNTPVAAVFLGPAGWGRFHRLYADTAEDSMRKMVPVLLPGWREQDLQNAPEFFHKLLRIEFGNDKDEIALTHLADTVTRLAYSKEYDAQAASQPDSWTRRLMVYVPARSQTVESWAALIELLDQEKELAGRSRWLPWRYQAGAWSRQGLIEWALDLDAGISAELQKAEDEGLPCDRVTLLGHSFGGVLVHIAYLLSEGEYAEKKPHGSGWSSLVDRIVLFAAPNRGIDPKRFGWRDRAALLWPFGEVGRLARDQMTGSAAITDLRIRWIRHFRERAGRRRPAVIQLLGLGDRLVNRDDSLDLQQFPEASQVDVPGASHSDVHVVPPKDRSSLRYVVLRNQILRGQMAPEIRERQHDPKNPVVIILHGIRANNQTWALQVSKAIRKLAPNACPVTPTYHYFPMLDFAIPFLRQRQIRWLQDTYSQLLAQYPTSRFHFIGHSNGTYMLGHCLDRIPGMRFERVTLAGSVLPREFPWTQYFDRGQVEGVVNHRASKDLPVALLCNMLRAFKRDVGTAGFDGFDSSFDGRITEVFYYRGGHGRHIEKDNVEHLARYTLSGETSFPLASEEVDTGTVQFLSRLSGSRISALFGAIAVVAFVYVLTQAVASGLTRVVSWEPLWIRAAAAIIVLCPLVLFTRKF